MTEPPYDPVTLAAAHASGYSAGQRDTITAVLAQRRYWVVLSDPPKVAMDAVIRVVDVEALKPR